VMASPIPFLARVTYPADGSTGWGSVTRYLLTGLGRGFSGSAPINLSPNNDFLRSLDQSPPELRFDMGCPVNGVDQVAILPLADAVSASPVLPKFEFPTTIVPSFHGGLLNVESDRLIVARALQSGSVPGGGLYRAAYDLIAWGASAWQVPSLVATPDSSGCETAVSRDQPSRRP